MAPRTERPLDLPRLFGPDMQADPHPVYHRLRAADPVHWEAQAQALPVTF